jgi:lysophospholipid acyltransferase (LPLAT)-like uncharacterized protein
VKVDGVDYSNPNRFTLRQRIILAIVPVVFAWVYRLLAATWRYEVRNRERLDELTRREGVALFGVWHECIAPFLHLHKGRGVHSAASQSFDGELAARVLRRFQIGIVRGSSSRGGGFALENLLKAAPHVPAHGANH